MGEVALPPLVIVTGLSGAGKSTAMRVLEDLGFYCIDNLPPALIVDFYDLYEQSEAKNQRAVVACDVRAGELFDDVVETMRSLEDAGVPHEIVFLDCRTDVLIDRFNEVRRAHPLQKGRSLQVAIEDERQRLEPLKKMATKIIDTGALDSASLREEIAKALTGSDTASAVHFDFLSFGFKHGLPRDADFVFDVRFLPNPFYEPELRNKSGLDTEVFEYVMEASEADLFFSKIIELLDATITSFARVGKLHLSVAIGCTGGRHRSVAFTHRLFKHFSDKGMTAREIHRDMNRHGS